MPQLLQVAQVPFATHGAEMTGVGRTAEAWNWFKMKWRSVFLWDQTTSENTNSSLFPPPKSDPYHCFSSSYFLVWKPKPTYTITHEFFTWPNDIRQFAESSWNGEDKMPPSQFLQTVRYKALWPILCHSEEAPQVAVTRGHSEAAGSAEQSNISGSDGHLNPTTQAWQPPGAILTFHEMAEGNVSSWGARRKLRMLRWWWMLGSAFTSALPRHLSARPTVPAFLNSALSEYTT